MPGNSKFRGYIDYDPNEINWRKPIDPSSTSVLINNAIHLGDVASQVKVNWVPAESAIKLNPVPDKSDEFYPIWGTRFDILRSPSGAPYKLRVRLAGFAEGVGSATEIKLRLVIGEDKRRNPTYVRDTSLENVLETSTTSTTNQWLTGGVMTIPNEIGDSAVRTIPIKKGPEGGLTTVDQARYYAEVWGSSADIDEMNAAFGGLYIAEWVGG